MLCACLPFSRSRLGVLAALFVAPFVGAQNATVAPDSAVTAVAGDATPPALAARGVTRLVMGVDVGNGIIAAAPPSRVSVPPYEHVILSGPTPDADSLLGAGPFQWRKNGQIIPDATAATYDIPLATAADRGLYTVTGLDAPFVTTGIKLNVVPEGHLANQSTRVKLRPGDDVAFLGFVVDGNQSKSLLIRGVGPSLAPLGVTDPIAKPRIQLFDAQGKELAPVARVQPQWNFAAWFASLGAFPLVGQGNEGEETLERAFTWRTFAPGIYSIQLRDASGQGGTGLIEIYEFTDGPAAATTVTPTSD